MAGAGTGKTYSLVENYLSALFALDQSGEKKRPQEILALTFTQKAAHEMRLRITKRLSEFLNKSSLDPLAELALNQGASLPDADEIKRLLRSLPNAPIATFHGFCADFLRKFAKDIGIDDGFEILSPDEETELARNILRPIILTALSKNGYIKSLVARFRLGNGLSHGLVDGLLGLYFKLFEKGIDVEDLAFHLNRVSQGDIHQALVDIKMAHKDFLATKMTAKTKEKLIEIEAQINLFPGIEPFDESLINERFLALRKSVGGNFGEALARKALVEEVVKLGAKLVDYQSYAYEVALIEILLVFHKHFEEHKQALGKLSYADLLGKTKDALLSHLKLRKKAKAQIKHLLIDEYQDTSPLQEDIVSLLLEDKDNEQPLTRKQILKEVSFLKGPSLFVVGDKKQSIYGFRGADSSLFDSMIEKMALTHKEVDGFLKRLLTTNRRSKKSILTLVNLVANHALGSDYADDQALVPFAKDEGACALWVGDESDNANLKVSAFGVAHLIDKGHKASDIVILVRRIKSASVIKEHLSHFGINCRIVGGDGFYQAQEVVDILSFFRLINHPGDSLALAVVLRSPLVLLLDQEILEVVKFGAITVANVHLAYEADKFSAASKASIERFFGLLDEMRALIVKSGLAFALDKLIESTDFSYALGLMSDPLQKWANIEKLATILSRSHKNPFILIDEYYSHVLKQTKEPVASKLDNEDACTIMTIHQSKGLEFKVVVLADGESTLSANYENFLADENLGVVIRSKMLPACVPKDQESQLAKTRYQKCKDQIKAKEEAEMARLLYVAMTRAKDELYIACSKKAFLNSGKTSQSLVGLFLRAYENSKEQFLATCSIDFVERPERVFETPKPLIADEKIFHYQEKVTRIFASALEAKSLDIRSLIEKQSKSSGLIDGDLGHKLLALVGGAVLAKPDLEAEMIDRLIDASMRAQNLSKEHFFETMKAVKETLTVLKNGLLGHSQAIFELPLSFYPGPKILIEGFADLVVEFADFIGVIEFKSSTRLVHEANTYLQVLAYAEALLNIGKPLKYAVVLVGSSKKLSWQNYDEQARGIFLNEMEFLAGTET